MRQLFPASDDTLMKRNISKYIAANFSQYAQFQKMIG